LANLGVAWESLFSDPDPVRRVEPRASLDIVTLGAMRALRILGLAAVLVVAGCGSSPAPPSPSPPGSASVSPPLSATSPPSPTRPPLPNYGNPDGHAVVPAEAKAEDTSHPTQVIGDGTPASCTSAAVVSAVAAGGVLTFSCGPAPVTITMDATAKVRNDHGPKVVLDGGGLVTLSGGGKRRILYQNTCDKSLVWTSSHCQDQETPQLTVQNLTFADGNSTGQLEEGGGGGAIFVRGGRFKVVNSRFLRNRCDSTGPDLGGAAIRVLSQYHTMPVYIVNSTFGGAAGQGGVCSNGGALSSIQVSWTVLNSVLSGNSAIGHGANPAKPGTPGGGSGGAIYLDGNTFQLHLGGTLIENNHAVEGGGAVFFVSNDRTGTMAIDGSVLRHNPNDGFATAGLPGIFFLGAQRPTITASTLS
jgi:hypothetical protein